MTAQVFSRNKGRNGERGAPHKREGRHFGEETLSSQEFLLRLFRSQSGRIISTLLRYFGIRHIKTVERIAHDSFLRAGSRWSIKETQKGLTDEAWQIAKALAFQFLCAEKSAKFKKYEIMVEKDGEWSPPKFFVIEEREEDRLKLFLTLLRPKLDERTKKLLFLNLLLGYPPSEIRDTFFPSDPLIADKLNEAKKLLAESDLQLELPKGEDPTACLGEALETLFWAFNKIISSDRYTSGEKLPLCEDLIDTARLLLTPPFNEPRTHALLSYMLLNASILSGGSPSGKSMLNEGINELHLSARGRDVTIYHLEAGIAACLAGSTTPQHVDWGKMVDLYDSYLRINPSEDIALRRKIALEKSKGA
ncbi:MAG: hypothetical protein QXX77_09325 [Candidatus Methanosuratincola sp.]|jgi:RNA polymerase sigma-70 factor (ECF subfamily)